MKLISYIIWGIILSISIWIFLIEEVVLPQINPTPFVKGNNINLNHTISKNISTNVKIDNFEYQNNSILIHSLIFHSINPFKESVLNIINDIVHIHKNLFTQSEKGESDAQAVIVNMTMQDVVIDSNDIDLQASRVFIENGDVGFFKTALYKNIIINDLNISGSIVKNANINAELMEWKYPNQTIKFIDGNIYLNNNSSEPFSNLTYNLSSSDFKIETNKPKNTFFGIKINSNIILNNSGK